MWINGQWQGEKLRDGSPCLRTCITCRWQSGNHCQNPANAICDRSIGPWQPSIGYARTDDTGACGPDGALWEQRGPSLLSRIWGDIRGLWGKRP